MSIFSCEEKIYNFGWKLALFVGAARHERNVGQRMCWSGTTCFNPIAH